MKQNTFQGVDEDAFGKRLKISEYFLPITQETVIETWYYLSFDDARRFIDDTEWIELQIEHVGELQNPWIKLITFEHTHTTTGAIRRHFSTSLRPYIQGYGCDGTTDLNIHALANRLAEQHGLDYPSLLACAYPDQFSRTDDFQWLNDEVVLAETVIPKTIDADLVLRDLQQINNYTLAIEFGIALHKIDVISTDWAQIREYQNIILQQMRAGC